MTKNFDPAFEALKALCKDQNEVMNQGLKYDEDKNRVDLLDAEWLEGVGQVLTFGARKYAANNWRGGISYSRLLGGCFRHLYAFCRGEDTDPESGLSHLLHASCCLMFLYWHTLHRTNLDDRYKGQQ